MSTDTAERVLQLSDYGVRLAAARDRSYKLARDAERSKGVLNSVAHDPLSDAGVRECAREALESLCENLVRLCALTDQASLNAEALSSLPLKFFLTDSGTATELDAAVASLADATLTAESELTELARLVTHACEAVDTMRRPERIG